MKYFCLWASVVLFCMLAGTPAWANYRKEFKEVKQQALDQYRAGHYEEALATAQKALELAGRWGSKPGDVLNFSLNAEVWQTDYAECFQLVGMVQVARGNYRAAEVAYERAYQQLKQVTYRVQTSPVQSVSIPADTSMAMNDLAHVYVLLGQYSKAKPIH